MSENLSGLKLALIHALARGIENRSTNVARSSISARDPLVWWLAQRRLRVLLERERLLSFHDEPSHHMRRLSVKLADFEVPEADDIELVSAEYERRVRPLLGVAKSTYFTWAILALLMSIAAAGMIYRFKHRPFDPHSIRAAAFIEQNLSDWTAANGQTHALRFANELQSPTACKLLGNDVCQSLSTMLQKGATVSRATPDDLRLKAREFTDSQSAVDAALLARGLPLFVDASLLPKASGIMPLIMTYYVERDEWFEYRGQMLRAVSAWRMDPMRISLPALGYVREGNPVAIISYDLVESVLVLRLLPSLVEKEPAFVFDEETRGRSEGHVLEFEARLGDVLRRHFNAAHLDPNTRRLGELLAMRRNLITKWRRTIVGFPIAPPERLLPEHNLGERLEQYISRTEAITWGDLSDELANARIVEAFERQRDELSNAIKRHELQHLIDQKEGLAGIPVALARRLRVDAASEPEPYSLFGAARSELSAYMAQIADGPYPRLSLVHLATAVFDRNMSEQPHHFAALALFDGLMRTLHLTDDEPSYREAVVRVIEFDPIATAAATRTLYEEWFGRPLGSLERRKIAEGTHWRH